MAEGLQGFIDTYGPYLNDAWRRLYWITICFIVAFAAGFFFAGKIIQYMVQVFRLEQVTIVVTSPFQLLDLSVDVGFLVALFVTVPFAVLQLCVFLRPALSGKEFRSILMLLPVSLVLFVLGFVYGFFSLYLGLQALAKINTYYGLTNMWDVSLFFAELVVTASLLGALFQYPLMLYMLMKMRMVDRDWFIQKRRVAYAAILILVALLPPTDGVSLIIMTLPLVGLYEVTILLTYDVRASHARVMREKILPVN